MQPRFITALGTPLDSRESLDVEGLEAHLADQLEAGTPEVLAAGSMGVMQLLRDQTYCDCVERVVHRLRGKAAILVGAGDTSFARTRDRIAFLNRFDIDGVAVIAPYFLQFGQGELVSYVRALADESRAPIYYYDMPETTRTRLTLESVARMVEHPNVRGMKCSGDLAFARQVADLADLAEKPFRLLLAQFDLIDLLLRGGFAEHLDGMFALAPGWVQSLGRHAAAGRWPQAALCQRALTHLRNVMFDYGIFPAFSALMNARGIGGCFAPRPFLPLDSASVERLCAEPIVARLLRGEVPGEPGDPGDPGEPALEMVVTVPAAAERPAGAHA